MDSDESHCNVSVGSDGQSRKTGVHRPQLFEEKGEPKQYRTEVLPLTSLTPYHLRPQKPYGLLGTARGKNGTGVSRFGPSGKA